MCEPLRGKKIKIAKYLDRDYISEDSFRYSDVKSAVEFYKKCRNPNKAPDYLYIEYEDTQKEHNKNWADWLFDYCFGDVIDGKDNL